VGSPLPTPRDSPKGFSCRQAGLRSYLRLETFTHRNTDGPLNPYARVYSLREAAQDFPDFVVVDSFKRYLHAPPLPVHGLPDGSLVGWHLWVTLRARLQPSMETAFAAIGGDSVRSHRDNGRRAVGGRPTGGGRGPCRQPARRRRPRRQIGGAAWSRRGRPSTHDRRPASTRS
jgi:hypothetical protein